MNRKLKFRAWVPSIQTMLSGVDVYENGMIGLTEARFEKQLNPAYEWDGEDVSSRGDGECVLNVLTSQEYLWIESGKYAAMQYTGLVDTHKNEFIEGDLCSLLVDGTDTHQEIKRAVVEYNLTVGGFGFKLCDGSGWMGLNSKGFYRAEIIGNIYEHPNMKNSKHNERDIKKED